MDYLLKELNSNPLVNMQEDWKLLTIFIGANGMLIYHTKKKKNKSPPSMGIWGCHFLWFIGANGIVREDKWGIEPLI